MAWAEVEEIRCATLINSIRVPYLPFRWTINTYRGCRHACRYCFARRTHEFLGLNSGPEFDQRVFAKVNAPEVLRAELRRPGWRQELIAFGTASDPYEPAEAHYRLSRRVLEVLRDYANPVSITTKGILIKRDADVLRQLARVAEVHVNFSVGTLDEEVWRDTEPGTPNPKLRLEAMQSLVESGVPAGVIAAPILPGLSDSEESLERVVKAAVEHKAQYLGANVLHLRPGSKEWFMPFIREAYPHIAPLYALHYNKRAYATEGYTQRVLGILESLRARWGLDRHHQEPREPVGQLQLAFAD